MLGLLRRFDFIRSLFGGDQTPATDASASRAKERLRNTLIMDQATVSSELMGVIREAMIGAVSRYLEIDVPHLQVGLERRNSAIALAANIPIVRVRKEGRSLMPNPGVGSSTLEESFSTTAVAVMEKHEEEVAGDESSLLSSDEGDAKDSGTPIKLERRNRRGRKHSH